MLQASPQTVTSGQMTPEMDQGEEPSLSKLKQDYTNYLDIKQSEIHEQKINLRYYHGDQWTKDQIAIFRKRRQPVVTYNRTKRKMNALVGLLESQKRDPKAYGRNPGGDEQAAEIATAGIRYVCDEARWEGKSPICGRDAAVQGIGGIEIVVDPQTGKIELEVVDPTGFFYARSSKADFSDCRAMGQGKWADVDSVIELFPDKEEEIRSSVESGYDLTSDPAIDQMWLMSAKDGKLVRIVDHWYKVKGEWHWCIYTGMVILAWGKSYLVNPDDQKTICKYIMFTSDIDQDGDRYGMVRDLISPQDEVNQRRSKGLHVLNSRRVFMPKGSGNDIEQVRTEMARPDGVIEFIGDTAPVTDDSAKGQELQGQLLFMQDAKDEIENFGFNPALIGQGVDQMSGRAIKLQQQAGIAELGPYLLAYRDWKLRVYRAIWYAIKGFWTMEKWIRVTDPQDPAQVQFIGLNILGIDPQTGAPVIQNNVAQLDMDIILDEGNDAITTEQDTFDTLSLMGTKGAPIPPDVIIDLSPLPYSTKKRVLDRLEKANQPDPMQVKGAQAEIAVNETKAQLQIAQANKAMADAGTAGMNGETGPSEIEVATALADIRLKRAQEVKTIADAQQSQAKTQQIRTDTMLKPVEVAHQQQQDRQNFEAGRDDARHSRTVDGANFHAGRQDHRDSMRLEDKRMKAEARKPKPQR